MKNGVAYKNQNTYLLKAYRQISKKRCFGKYCSCDQACQFSASKGKIYKEKSSTFYSREEKII